MSPAPTAFPNPYPRPTPLLTEAEALARPGDELSPAAPLTCAACACPPNGDGPRIAMQEVWFTCGRGHLNALGSSSWQEAA